MGDLTSSGVVTQSLEILAPKLIFAEGGKPEKNLRSQIEINQSQPRYEPRIEPGAGDDHSANLVIDLCYMPNVGEFSSVLILGSMHVLTAKKKTYC